MHQNQHVKTAAQPDGYEILFGNFLRCPVPVQSAHKRNIGVSPELFGLLLTIGKHLLKNEWSDTYFESDCENAFSVVVSLNQDRSFETFLFCPGTLPKGATAPQELAEFRHYLRRYSYSYRISDS